MADLIIDEESQLIHLPREGYRFPQTCAICLKPTSDTVTIAGGKSPVLDMALAMASSCIWIDMQVPVCQDCQCANRHHKYKSVALGLIGFLTGATLMVPNNTAMKLTGLALLFLCPLIAWRMSSATKSLPHIRTYTKDHVVLEIREREYMARYIEFADAENIPYKLHQDTFDFNLLSKF